MSLRNIQSGLYKAASLLSGDMYLPLSAADVAELLDFKSLCIHGTQESLEPASQKHVKSVLGIRTLAVLDDLLRKYRRSAEGEADVSADLILAKNRGALKKWYTALHREELLPAEDLGTVTVYAGKYVLYALLTQSISAT